MHMSQRRCLRLVVILCLLLYILLIVSLPFLYLSCSQDSELSYAHRDGRLMELIDEAWQRDELPNDGKLTFNN